jgi:hypothetical protein
VWAAAAAAALGLASSARADDATITVGSGRFAASPSGSASASRAVAPLAEGEEDADDRLRSERHRSAVRLALGPSTVTTGKGVGVGVGIGAEFGTGSVGGRLSAGWLRGEGTSGSGASTPTGKLFSHYGGELTIDFLKRGPWHPSLGMGLALVHVSRDDAKSGFAGAGTGRVALEYALGLEDADVRVGASATGGLIGPSDDELADLRGYAQLAAHLAIGF